MAMGDTRSGDNGTSNNNAGILSTLQNGVRALGNISTMLGNIFPSVSGTSTTATGGAITPPAQVVGYVTVTLPGGTSVKVPYYG